MAGVLCRHTGNALGLLSWGMSSANADSSEFPLNRAAFCGLAAMLVGVGIARFGYAPLVPPLIAAHWFSASTAFWLGTVNLLGYLIGAGGMRAWPGKVHTRPAIIGMMALTDLCLFASAWNGGVVYFGLWRLLSGITGGVLMVLMAAAVVGRAPPDKRGRAGGITFAGMGLGITASGLLIPRLLPLGLDWTWALLGGVSLLLTLLVAALLPGAVIEAPPTASPGSRTLTRPVLLLFAGYALCALGFVPHMLFLASFVAIGLHQGIAAGAGISAVMGLAAAFGPPVLGRIADRYGFLRTLVASYVIMAVAVALPLFASGTILLSLSAFGAGAVALGTVLLTSGALANMVPPARLAGTWGLATMTYGVAQALVAAGFSTLFHITGSYRLLFAIACVASLASAGLVALARKESAVR